MTISRMDLDGVGSPTRIAELIHQLQPDLPLDFSIEALCKQLDIVGIEKVDTAAFEAALIMDIHKASGSILLAEGSSPKRQRFSIGHELGHFLIPTHRTREGEQFACSHTDLRASDTKEKVRHRRIEAEANRFAASLLMAPKKIRAQLRSRKPDLAEVARLASDFRVSNEAMARSYVDAHRETLAVVILKDGHIDRTYRPDDFPWVEPRIGTQVPYDSIASGHGLMPGEVSEMEECDPETWLGERASRSVDVLCEQVLCQRNGYATILLHAGLGEED